MQRHWKRPWISLAVLAAVATSMLAWPAPASQAQATTYPGQTDPVGTRPGGLTQFPDDELLTLNDADSTQYSLVEYSPNADYSLPAAVDADVLQYRPTGQLPYTPGGYQIQNETASGRIVVPDRDVALTLSKTGSANSRISWALQEMSFGTDVPSAPKSVPALTWTSQTFGLTRSEDSPGALAIGDVDRALTPNATYGATYNDEAVVAYEILGNIEPDVQLDVVSYTAQPGQATVVASTTTATTNTGQFAYPCNVAWDGSGGCGLHPGNIKVATGDMDGDGFEDIVLLAMMNTYLYGNERNTIQSYLYSYCPAALTPADGRVAAGICAAGAAGATLQLRGSAEVDGALIIGDWAMFQSPVEMTTGDFDGDGGLELAVLHQTYMSLSPNPVAIVTMSIVQWTGTASTPWQKVYTNEAPSGKPLDLTLITNAWYDGGQSGSPLYDDMHLAAGLFKFDPELGYPLNRRQLAVAWAMPGASQTSGRTNLQLELWELASPNSPGANPPSQWTLTRYDSTTDTKAVLCFSGSSQQSYASFGLVAGNWAGVKANPASPLWGVGIAYEGQVSQGSATQVTTQLYRVDQNIDSTTANGPLTLAATTTIPKLDAGGCGTSGRVELLSLDIDGDSIRLGAPMHTVAEIPQVYDWILQEPPQHLDYFPNGGLVNVSRNPNFNVGYTDAQARAFSENTANTSDWTVGTSVKANATGDFDANFLVAKAQVSASVSNQFNYDYDNNKNDYTGNSDIYTSTLTTQTAAGDSLRFRGKLLDIWRYPAFGVASPNPGQPYAYYELMLPRANDTPYQNMDDLAAQTYGYQPPHENGNLLSYPAVAAGDALQPADIGQWVLPPDIDTDKLPPGAVRCQNNTRWCWSSPLTNTTQQFSFGATNSSLQLQVEQSYTSGGSRAWSNKLSDSLDVEASAKFSVFGTGGSGCVNAQVHGGYSWGQSSTWVNASDETQTLTVNVPATNNSAVPYHFNPMMYITGDGVIKVAHGAGTDNGGSFWTARYSAADPALNLPRKFNQPQGATTWELNKQWLDAQQLRGFWVRSATPNPVTNTNDVVDGVKVGQTVLLDARVYNYSVSTQTGSVPVRFDLEPVDPANNYQATGPRFTASTVNVNVGPLPYHGQEDSTGTPVPNYTSARYQLDTSTLPPAGVASQTYRVWVVLDPDNTIQGQTHGWRQPNVILTPETTLQAGTTLSVQLQDAGGKVLDTVNYTSQGTSDNIAVGLMNALKASPVLQQFGATASVQDTTTSTPSVVVFKSGATAPAGSEFRAGIVSGSQALYFVPQVPTTGVPTVTATNLEYGQNNEGWGLLTVYKSATPGPMLGSDDPCGLSSGYSAARGPDIQLRRSSLTPMAAGGRVAGGKTVVQAGDRVPIRVSAFAGTHWAGFERVTVYQGEPEDGSPVAGTALIRGIDAKTGGHGWFTWQAPTTPGTYTLVAQLQEHHNDAAPGNNQATVEIVVEGGPKLPYRRFLGAISRGPQ